MNSRQVVLFNPFTGTPRDPRVEGEAMTLLEWWDGTLPDTFPLHRNQIRRALAVAQAVEEFGGREFNSEPSSAYGAYNWITLRADELLKEGK